MQLTQEWDKIFPQSNKVEHHKVTFRNRYGITLVGDLYVPKNIRSGQKLPAIAVVGAFGAVKEQSSGLYAQEMAERGFVTLAFDGSFTGESGGEPRNIASPEINFGLPKTGILREANIGERFARLPLGLFQAAFPVF